MRREERVTVQGPVKEQQPDGMSHRGVTILSLGVLQLYLVMGTGGGAGRPPACPDLRTSQMQGLRTGNATQGHRPHRWMLPLQATTLHISKQETVPCIMRSR